MDRERLWKIINAFHSDGYYKYGNIPAKKLENAIQHYPIDPNETVLALVDTTVFGSAKTGMAIGLKGVYWKNDWTGKTTRTFMGWEELARSNSGITFSGFDLHLAPGCEFGMSGCSMKKEVLANLLKQLVQLYKELSQAQQSGTGTTVAEARHESAVVVASALPPSSTVIVSQSSGSNGLYNELVPEMLAACIVVDGQTSDDEVELATVLIEGDELIGDKSVALESLSSHVERLLKDRQKSSALFKLKTATLTSKIAKIDDASLKERLHVLLDGFLEIAQGKSQAETIEFIKTVKSKIVG